MKLNWIKLNIVKFKIKVSKLKQTKDKIKLLDLFKFVNDNYY